MKILADAVVIFFMTAIADSIWAKYIETAAAGQALPAAFWSCMIFTFGAGVTIGYVNNHWMLIPVLLGSFAGTYLTIKLRKKP